MDQIIRVLNDTPEPLYNTLHYNTVLVKMRSSARPQKVIKDEFTYLNDYIIVAFCSIFNKAWIANTEFGLDPNNSVIKRLWNIHSNIL